MSAAPEQRWKPNVTVAAVVVRQDADGPRYLLVEEQTADGLRLNNPAGHLDPGETPQRAAERECLEETACRFTPQALLGVYLTRMRSGNGDGNSNSNSNSDDDVTFLRFAYSGTVGEPEPGRALDEPIVRTLWLTPDEVRASVARHRSPMVLRCIEDHLAGRRLPLDAVYAHSSLFG